MASPTQWTLILPTLGDGEGQGSLVGCSPWGHRVRQDGEAGQQLMRRCVCVDPSPGLSLPFFLAGNHTFVFYSVALLLFCKQAHLYILDSTQKQYHVLVFLCLTHFTQCDSL